MKKTYETPVAERISFSYRDQVVATSGAGYSCIPIWKNVGKYICETTPELHKPSNM